MIKGLVRDGGARTEHGTDVPPSHPPWPRGPSRLNEHCAPKKKTISITVIQKKISIKEGCLNHGKIYIFELFCIMIIFDDANEIGRMVLDYR